MTHPRRLVMTGLALAAVLSGALAATPTASGATALGTPTLASGVNIRKESGLVGGLLVDRYTWRDSKGRPRSIALVRYGNKVDGSARGGYANRITYQVQNATTKAWTTITISPPINDQGDGGFGYFVSHEYYRTFAANVCPDGSNSCPLASLHGDDDSPLGSHLSGSGSTTSISSTSAIHTFSLNYPHWGTVDPVDDIYGTTPSDPASHRKYNLPATIRWQVTKGKDYPLITLTYDFRGVPANVISVDMRGPYGWLNFAPGDAALTKLQWGDRYLFSTTGSSVTTNSGWTWAATNGGARYNLLVAGKYELGLVEAKAYGASTTGSGYSDARGKTSANGQGCPDAGWNLPCDWEWTYQSIQYEDFGTSATHAKKLAWGTAPYIGTTLDTDDAGEAFSGYPVVSYKVWLTFDASSGSRTRALAASYH